MPNHAPLTVRAQDTRDKLLRAARAVFEEEGYGTASVSRVVERADVSRGTFYLYFDSKQDVFRTLVLEIRDGLLRLQADSALGERRRPSPEQRIEHAVRAYVDFYRRHARMLAVLEQVATYDEGLRELRLEMRRSVSERARDFIVHLQASGAVPTTVDPRYASFALTGMVDRFVFVWLILGEDFEEEHVVRDLTRLWYQAIGGTVSADPPAGSRPCGGEIA